MTHIRISPFFLIVNIMSLILVFTIVSQPRHLGAVDFGGNVSNDIATDSEIVLTETTSGGSYQVCTIRISTINNESTLTVDVDGEKNQKTMLVEDCSNLWQYLLERDCGNMPDAPPENLLPDQSVFTIKCRVGSTINSCYAYGVDFLTDARYKEIVREIISVCEKYIPLQQ
ncbi:MAG: hypothetical protein ACYST3_08120 [Planctomycetota bacterium]|jgi:hypothetical protein